MMGYFAGSALTWLVAGAMVGLGYELTFRDALAAALVMLSAIRVNLRRSKKRTFHVNQ